MKILLGDFNAKVRRETTFKPALQNENQHQDSNDYGFIIVNVATSKNLVVKSKMFPHRDIHKYNPNSLDGKTHFLVDHILIDRKRQSSIIDVRSFRGADCDADHYLVVTKVRERLAVNKHAAQRLDGERFNLRKLKDLEVKKQYEIKALRNVSYDDDTNRALENIKENIETSAKKSLCLRELKQHKLWFDEECLHFLDERKQAKFQ